MVSAFSKVRGGGNASVISLDSADADLVSVPDAQLLLTAHIRRAGPDLVLTGPDGRHHIIPGYFANKNRPTLVAPNGARLSFDNVALRAGCPTPSEYAQAAPTTPSDLIGKVKKVDGTVIVIRDGAALTPKVGAAMFKGDVIETGTDGLIALVFADGTTFNLYASTRMVLDEFICGAEKSSDAAVFRIIKGAFAFFGGKLANTGRLIIETPLGQIQSTGPAAGFGSLAFSVLTFGLIHELKAASADITLLDDGTIDYKDSKHGVFEFVTKEAHPRRIIVDDPGETIVLRPGASGTVSVEHVANSPVVMAQYQGAYQATHDSLSRGLQDPFIQHYQEQHAFAQPTNNPVNAANNASAGSTGSSTSISDQPGASSISPLPSTTTIATTVVPSISSAPTVTTVVTAAAQPTAPTPTAIPPPLPPPTTTGIWNSPTSGPWNNAQDWSGATVPGPQNAVTIAQPVTVTVDATEFAASLTVAAGTTLAIVSGAGSGGSLTASGAVNDAGTIQVNSAISDPSLTLTGAVTIASTGVIEATGSNLATITFSGATVDNFGNVEAISGGIISLAGDLINESTGSVLAKDGGIVTITPTAGENDGTITADNATVNLDLSSAQGVGGHGNVGTIQAIDAGTFTITGSEGQTFNNPGTLQADSGGSVVVEVATDNTGGHVVVSGAGSFVDFWLAVTGGNATISDGGKLEYGWLSNVATSFIGSGTLVLDHQVNGDPQAYVGTLSNVGSNDLLDLTGFQTLLSDSITTTAIYNPDSNTTTLTATDIRLEEISAPITLAGNYSSSGGVSWSATSDGDGGILLVLGTAPLVAILSSGGPTNQTSQTISGTVTENNSVPVGTTVALFDSVNGGAATQIGTATVSGAGGSWTTSTPVTLSAGTNSIVAKDTDTAGNTGASTAVVYTVATVVAITSGNTLELAATNAVAATFANSGGTLIANGLVTGVSAPGISATSTDGSAMTIDINAAGGVTSNSADAIDATNSGGAGNISITANGPVTGAIDGINATQNGTGNITIGGSGTITGQAGNGILAEQSATGFGGLLVDGTGDVTGTGSSIDGILAEIVNTADTADVTVNQTANVSGGASGINAFTDGTGNVSVTTGANATISGATLFGIEAASFGTGSIVVTTAPGDTITTVNNGNNGSAAITAVNRATVVPQSDTSSVTVNAYGTIDTGTTLTPSGVRPAGIIAGYLGEATGSGTPDASVFGNVFVNNYANITAAAGDGIRVHNYGVGNATVIDGTFNNLGVSGTTINAPQYGIDAFTAFSGDISVSTAAGDMITSGGTGILADNQATAIAASADSTVTVTNDATINSGSTTNTGGNTPGGIEAGYDANSGTADLNLNGTVLVNNSANVTAPSNSGWGIDAFNFGNGNVTVNDLAATTTVTGPTGIGAYQNSGGTGDVVVSVAAGAMISATGTGTDPGTTRANGYGIQAISEGTGSISVTTASNDTITSTSDGIEVLNGASTIPASDSSAITVTAFGTINSGSLNEGGGFSPAGISAAYKGSSSTNTANLNVFDSITINDHANITASAGFGIKTFDYGQGNITIEEFAGSTISPASGDSLQDGIVAEQESGGSGNITISIDSGATVTGNTGIFALLTGAGTVQIINSGTITGTAGQAIGITLAANDTAIISDTGTITGKQNVTFSSGGNDTLVLDQPSTFTGTISGISGSTDVLDLKGFDTSATVSYSGSATGGTLTVSEGSTTVHLTVAGTSIGTFVKAGLDSAGTGLLIHDPPLSPAIGDSGTTLASSAVTAQNVTLADTDNLAGVAGAPIGMAMSNPPAANGRPLTATITGIPSDWQLNEGRNLGNGTWVVESSDLTALTVLTGAAYAGAVLLGVTETWANADGSTGSLSLSDNVQAYAAGLPIFAVRGDDTLTGAGADNLFVFAQPIGNEVIADFNVASDKIDLVGFDGVGNFGDIRITDDANGNAVISLGSGETITLRGIDATLLTASNFEFDQTPVTTNAGNIVISDGTTLSLTGIIDNSGTIELNSTGNATVLQIAGDGLTLEGGGQIVMSDSDMNFIVATSSSTVLTNIDNTISGAGQIGAGDGHLTLVNDSQGTIVANDTGGILTINTGNTATNDGILEATNGGTLQVDDAVIGTGSATVAGGTVEFAQQASINVIFDNGQAGTSYGELVLANPSSFSGQIIGFTGTAPDASHSDAIDLVGVNYGSYTFTESHTASADVLTVSNGSTIANLTIDNSDGALSFSSDGHGGSLVTDPSADSSAVSAVVIATPEIAPGDSYSESMTPSGANYVGSASVAQDSNGGSFDFGFALGKDQIDLAAGQILSQSYDVSISDAQNPGADVSQQVAVLIGGPGSDNFVFTPGMGADSIVNFDPQQDTIELDHFASAQTVQQLQSLVTGNAHGDAVINLGHNDSITIAGETPNQLQQLIQAGHVLLH